ncbi:phosphoribosyltransferase [Pseudomonas fluorescens]|jgi:pyrimidine operon attenuation protein/uracil phosphoribosyltransferase|uniref:Phosphoribosyltransferase n=1 Tax=Pseudomonas gorinensis TaxID=3240790 RepID=A0ACA7P7T2_9PSED|nr:MULTISPECIES: phosphoribosyltransferase family protein [Pseudomonas]AHC36043.1 phosphoribosyltransferase [Pseudomonas sp. TKP]AOE68023.1 phosphoribosyltransferase [Pseudomonas fluorescens]AOE74160.1 phosphoribosyltransferase [Pseudomonas fluorescens]MBL1311298.1 phosphoribosyltransferase [Pseudomonas sp.]MDR6579936.1 pyrimidine operon attenuation protein/uracil phosphoribosyltransferase [Pseudomonas extremaustralis]
MTILLATQRLRLYDSNELDNVLQAMARKATHLLPASHTALIGLQRRGEPLAQRLRQCIARQTGQPELPLFPLQVKRYTDDLQVLHTYTQLIENPGLGNLDVANTTFLVVDDVLFEGHSLLRTCAYLAQLGACRVYTAVLVDRHVCQQPIRADIVGVHLQVAADDVVECNVPPFEQAFCIEVVRHGAAHRR